MPPEVRTQAVIDAELVSIDAQARGEQSPGPGSSEGDESAAEASASAKGWVPKDQFKGPEGKWKPASQFLADGEKYNKNLQREITELKAKISDFEGTKAQFAKFMEETVAAKQAEIDSLISSLRVQRSQATREGDDDLAIQLEDRIDLLKGQKKDVKKELSREELASHAAKGPNMDDPVLQEWIEDGNDWFKSDAKLRDYAVQLGSEMVANGETVRGRAFLDKVQAQMALDFPRKFAARATPPREGDVEGSTTDAGSRSKYSVRDLPAEDLTLMKDFIKKGYTTQEKFLANYFTEGRRVHRS